MFSALEFDFGTVARNEKSEHIFEIKNLYEEDIQVVGVTTSCRCTDLVLDKYVLKEGETAKLTAKFNTRQFTGFKQATVTIRFAPPFAAEVQLTVKGTIRGDVLFEPSSVDFGTITAESARNPANVRQIKITKFNNPNWRIVDGEKQIPPPRCSALPADKFWESSRLQHECENERFGSYRFYTGRLDRRSHWKTGNPMALAVTFR